MPACLSLASLSRHAAHLFGTVWGDVVKDNQVTFDYKPLDPDVNRVRLA